MWKLQSYTKTYKKENKICSMFTRYKEDILLNLQLTCSIFIKSNIEKKIIITFLGYILI